MDGPAAVGNTVLAAELPIVPVVLAGGEGTRLWPLSRAAYPKQFLTLYGKRSLFQETLVRAAAATRCEPVVVTAEAQRYLASEQSDAIGSRCQCIALEPAGRGTAAAIALGAHLARTRYGDALVLVLPADHRIVDSSGFVRAVQIAAAHALGDASALITFGVPPDRVETAFGYIEASGSAAVVEKLRKGDASRSDQVHPVRSFTEKPDEESAARFVASGRHFWNSGIFIFDARACLDALQAFCPERARMVERAAAAGRRDGVFYRPGAGYARCPRGSFDELVMERTDRAFVVPATFDWADLGSWQAIHQAGPTDDAGNRLVGDVTVVDVQDTLIHAGGRLVTAIGVDELVIVDSADALLVAGRNRLQDVRDLVERLKTSGRTEIAQHRETHRPWGRFEIICERPHYRVKRLILKPGAAISRQKHEYRSEHWVVVRGVAEVTLGEATRPFYENDSVYIPRQSIHRLRNPGPLPLEVIETQVGDCLDEDDIVRFDDDYGRAATAGADGMKTLTSWRTDRGGEAT